MVGIIERNAKETAVIMQCTEISDGKPVWEEVPCRCLLIDSSRNEHEQFGSVGSGRVFYVAPLASTPQLPAKIRYSNTEYDVTLVQVFRNLQGVLKGYKLTVAGM